MSRPLRPSISTVLLLGSRAAPSRPLASRALLHSRRNRPIRQRCPTVCFALLPGPARVDGLCAHGGRLGACVSTRKADIELHRLRLQSAETPRYQLRRGDTILHGPSEIPGGEFLLTALDPWAPASDWSARVSEEKYYGQRQADDLPVVRSRGSPQSC